MCMHDPMHPSEPESLRNAVRCGARNLGGKTVPAPGSNARRARSSGGIAPKGARLSAPNEVGLVSIR